MDRYRLVVCYRMKYGGCGECVEYTVERPPNEEIADGETIFSAILTNIVSGISGFIFRDVEDNLEVFIPQDMIHHMHCKKLEDE